VTEIGSDVGIKTLPTPQVSLGTAVCRVLQSQVLSYHREIYNGQRNYPVPTPLVGGCSAVGRIIAVGADATILTPGQLVWIDCVIRGRDDPNNTFLIGIHEGMSEGTRKLSHNAWRDGTFSEYVKMPLENCIPLDEMRLCKELGYSLQDLIYMAHLLVPFGGLRSIKLQPGETVIVCPATGGYGGAGVHVACAMGCRVIAMGRNETELV
jgi:NADPH:quinone reductase-like Zn-dependent oxidoreductase